MSKNNPAMENVKAPDVPTEQPATENKLGYRILALLLLAVSVLAIFLIPFNVLKNASAEVTSASLFQTILDLFKNGDKIFNLIPVYKVASGVAKIAYNGSIYLFAAALVIAAIINIFAMITGKKGVLKAALFFLMGGALLYAISYYLVAAAINVKSMGRLEMFSLIIAVVCALIYFVLAIKTAGKSVWIHLLQLVLTAGFSLVLVWAIASSNVLVTPRHKLGIMEYLFAVVIALTVINVLWASLRMEKEKAYIIDIVRLVFALAIAAIALVDAIQGETNLIFAIVAICIALVQLVIAILALLKSLKKEEPVEEPEDDGFAVEEYAEAYPYEGGPVAGVVMAQEVNPSFLPHEPHVNTAGYDFYNSKSFDPFIASLTTEERNQFTEIFILKFKGTMSELPEYVVGGDNKEFFRKIFIYLGQYRDRIPSNLLGKMYQYSLKI